MLLNFFRWPWFPFIYLYGIISLWKHLPARIVNSIMPIFIEGEMYKNVASSRRTENQNHGNQNIVIFVLCLIFYGRTVQIVWSWKQLLKANGLVLRRLLGLKDGAVIASTKCLTPFWDAKTALKANPRFLILCLDKLYDSKSYIEKNCRTGPAKSLLRVAEQHPEIFVNLT